MSNTIIYVFALIAVILVVGFIYGYFNKDKSSSNPAAFTSKASQDAYANLMTSNSITGKGGKRKRNKPRKRR